LRQQPDEIPVEIDLEEYLPHRAGMKLVERVVQADENGAVTESVAGPRWPLVEKGHVSSLVAVELAAQSASLCVGMRAKQKDPATDGGRGWLVGIKEARFAAQSIPVGSCITTRVSIEFSYENYTGIRSVADADGRWIADVQLQVMQSETDSVIQKPPKR
jgi:predicted hotdog family 3-hydroxylacyl-ACP dehydratase